MPPAETVTAVTLPDPATDGQIAPLSTDSAEIVPLVCADVRTLSGGGALSDLVCADLRSRGAFGVAKYGQPLRVRNGRSGIIDAYQEVLDACDYLCQAREQGEGDPLVYRQALRMALRLRATLLRRRQAPMQPEDGR